MPRDHSAHRFVVFAAALVALASCGPRRQAAPQAVPQRANDTPTRVYRVLQVMSYHTPWEWTEDLDRGFRDESRFAWEP